MPYRGESFVQGQYYHLYNRAVGTELLFYNPDNYVHCLRLVERYRRPYGAAIVAYCLMPNHYHFCIRQDSEQPLSRFVSVVSNAYVQALNRQQNRQGTLFQGRFRHVWVDRDEYLVHLCRYIHLNPVKAGLVSNIEDWPYSDYAEWIGLRPAVLTADARSGGYFPTPDAYRRFVADHPDETGVRERTTKYLLE